MVTAGICIAIVALTLWIKWPIWFPRDQGVTIPSGKKTTTEPVRTPGQKPAQGKRQRWSIVRWAFGILVVVIGVVSVVAFVQWIMRPSLPVVQIATVAAAPSPITFPIIPQGNPVAVATDKFWRENISSLQQANLMVWIAKEESGFRQFEEDGVTPYRGKVNPHDVGVMQINEDHWLAKAKELGYDITTLEGNLEMALWIYRNHGAREWTTHEEASRLASYQGSNGNNGAMAPPAPRWSERISTGVGTKIHPSGPVLYRAPNGSLYADGPGESHTMPASEWIEAQSRGMEPVRVTVSR